MEPRIASTDAIVDPAVLRRDLGRIYRLILNYGCWKRAAAQVAAQERFRDVVSHAS
jgi:hypothetical protein